MHKRLDKFLESKEIIANIKPNPRNGWFDGKKFKHVYPLFYFFSKIKK